MSKDDINQEDRDLFKKTIEDILPPDDNTDSQASQHDQLNYSHFSENFTVSNWHSGRDKVESSATGHLIKRLKRHKGKVDLSMDMHGMTVAEAAQKLDQFLAVNQSSEREKVILLIHGKGHQSNHDRPKLKNAAIHWLKLDNRVSAFCSAKEQDGGTGALYLLLRRKSQ